jgi:Leucine-rich repeat (LRR) protein
MRFLKITLLLLFSSLGSQVWGLSVSLPQTHFNQCGLFGPFMGQFDCLFSGQIKDNKTGMVFQVTNGIFNYNFEAFSYFKLVDYFEVISLTNSGGCVQVGNKAWYEFTSCCNFEQACSISIKDPDKIECGGTVKLMSTAPAGSLFEWTFANGGSSTKMNPDIIGVVKMHEGICTLKITHPEYKCEVILNTEIKIKNFNTRRGLIEGDNLCGDETILTATCLNCKLPIESYLWNPIADTKDIIVSQVGTYKTTITDDLGCKAEISRKIEYGIVPEFEIYPVTPICKNFNTTLKLKIDTGYKITRYKWSDATFKDSLKITKPGTYSVTITDKSGCTSSESIVIKTNYASKSDIKSSNTLCDSSTLLKVIFENTQQNPKFNWQDGSKLDSIFVNKIGTYKVTVYDDNGCDTVLQEKIDYCFCSRSLDSLALVSLYNQTNGKTWKDPWNLKSNMNTWKGLEFNLSNCVKSLILDNRNLIGKLPDSLGFLTNIENITISNHPNLSSSIPLNFNRFKKLKQLRLYNNNIDGSIPILDSLILLEKLVISKNIISGNIIPSIAKLINLEEINLDSNALTGNLPDSLPKLLKLKYFSVKNNKINGRLPSQYSSMKNLEILDLSYNNLEDTLPSYFTKFPSLKKLQLNNNNLFGCIPAEYTKLCNSTLDWSIDNNISLPWKGDKLSICNNISNQLGAPCDDNDSNTIRDSLNANCECHGLVCKSIQNILDTTVCYTPIFTYRGVNYSSSSIDTSILQSQNGCDSIVGIKLTILPKSESTLTQQLCYRDTFLINGEKIFSDFSGTKVLQGKSQYQCDSMINLNLTFYKPDTGRIDTLVCKGERYKLGNDDYRAGLTIIHKNSFLNCDSIVMLNIGERDFTIAKIDTSICEGSYFIFNNQDTLYSSGRYLDTLSRTIGNGCKVNEINLTVLSKADTILKAKICQGESYLFGSKQLDSQGEYVDTLSKFDGCDSIVTLQLEVKNFNTIDIIKSICQNDSILFKNKFIKNAGTYYDTIASNTTCDTLYKLQLVVNQSFKKDTQIAQCKGMKFIFNNQEYPLGSTQINLMTIEGCDSIIQLNCIELPIYHDTLRKSICSGANFMVNSNIYNKTGIYNIHLLTAVAQCDSIITLDLMVEDTIKFSIHESICIKDSFDFKNVKYPIGNHKVFIKDSVNCDSLFNLEIKQLPFYKQSIDTGFCKGNSIAIGGLTIFKPIDTVLQYTSIYKCDSSINLSVIEYPSPVISSTPDGFIPCDLTTISLHAIVQGQQSILWKDMNSNIISNLDSCTVTNAGIYILEAKSDKYCIIRDTILVTTADKPNNVSINTTSPLCTGWSDGNIEIVNVEGGKNPYRYSLYQNGIEIKKSQTRTIFNQIPAGNYSLKVEDNNNCVYIQNITIDPTTPATIEVKIDSTGLSNLNSGVSVNLIANLFNQVQNPVSYSWSSDNGSIACNFNCSNNLTFILKENTQIRVCAQDQSGCRSCDSLQLNIAKSKKVDDPDIITDESDGFKFEDLDLTTITGTELWIATRTGTIVYNHKNYQCCGNTDLWKGQNQDGSKLPTASYYYVFKIHYGVNKKDEIRKGTITWIR